MGRAVAVGLLGFWIVTIVPLNFREQSAGNPDCLVAPAAGLGCGTWS